MAEQLECPVGDCGYTGALDSIEAHISGSTTGDHSGLVGERLRSAIRNSTTGGESGGDGSSGLPVPDLSSEQWVLLAVGVVVLVGFLYVRGGGGGAASPELDEQDDEREPETYEVSV